MAVKSLVNGEEAWEDITKRLPIYEGTQDID
jgi:hypothetical protein